MCNGHRMCSIFANIFKTKFEEKDIYPYIKDVPLLYSRCIDDIFIIWKGTKEQLITYINELNKQRKPKLLTI